MSLHLLARLVLVGPGMLPLSYPVSHSTKMVPLLLTRLVPIALLLWWPGSLAAQEIPFRITEFLAVNSSGLQDRDGDFADWIEIRNLAETSESIGGWYLTDDPDNPRRWEAPAVEVEPGGYLIIFASGKDRASVSPREIHANFKLGRDEGYLALTNPDGMVVQEYRHDRQRRDISFGLDAAGETSYMWPSPGRATTTALKGFVEDTEFSVDRGFFDEPFEVAINVATEGAKIIYTTDGRIPSEGSIFTGPIGQVYDGPIRIEKTTVLRAAAFKADHLPSNVDTQTYLFLEQVIRQPADPQGFPERWVSYPADYAMDPRVVDDPAYRDEIVEGLLDIPTISIVMEPGDLFDAEQGIYARSTERGDAWERAGSVEWILPDGSEGFQENCGIRIHGFGWRSHENTHKHSFRLEFREAYGKTKLDYPLFPDAPVERFDSIVLRSQGSKSWQDFRDPEQTQYLHDTFARDTARDMGKIDGHATFAHLYLNGLYWGLYNPVERPDADFAAEYFGGEPEEYDAINRRTTTNEAIDGDLVAYNELLALASRGVDSLADYEAIQGYLDIDDLIDYMLIHQYTTNRDGPEEFQSNNMRGVRKREPGAKFRFFVWDMEYSLWEPDRNININVAVPGSISFVYARLREFPEFRLRYADHVRRHLFHGGALTPQAVLERWNRRSDQIYSALLGESARWGDAKRPSRPFTRDVEWAAERRRLVEDYFPMRTGILVRQLREAGLYPSVHAPDFSQHGGQIASGHVLRLTAGTLFDPQGGDFYYTLDGTDPRVYGSGAVATSAKPYDEETGIKLTESVVVKARTLEGEDWSALTEARFVVGIDPAPETLKISEIHYHPAAPTAEELAAGFDNRRAFEFIEIYNSGAEAMDLSGVGFVDGIRFSFSNGGLASLAPGMTALVVANREAFEMRYGSGLPVAGVFEGGQLANDGETVTLALLSGAVLHEVTYDDAAPWPTAADGDGYSLELANPMDGPGATEPDGWRTGAEPGGTPGRAGSGLTVDADSDGDGWTDFLEEAIGWDPGDPRAGEWPVRVGEEPIEVEGVVAPYWIVTVFEVSAEGSVVYQLERSGDLQTWEEMEPAFVLLEDSEQRLRYRSADSSKGAANAAAFVRLRVRAN